MIESFKCGAVVIHFTDRQARRAAEVVEAHLSYGEGRGWGRERTRVLLCVELEGCQSSQFRSADTIDDRALYFRGKSHTGRQVLRLRGLRGEEKGYMK